MNLTPDLSHRRRLGARLTIAGGFLLLLVASGCKGSGASTTTPTTTTTTTTTTSTTPVTLSATTLAFANFAAAGSAQSFTMTNTGTVVLNIASITMAGNFTQTNDCGTSMDIGVVCTITVTFNPQGVGSGGTLTITDDSATSPHTVAITGPNVVNPTGTLVPSTLTFASRAAGTTSPAQIVTLTNPINGISAPLAIVGTQITGDFAIAGTTCTGSVAPGSSCTYSLTFKPTGAGTRTGTFVVIDNDPKLAQSVALTGVGQ